MASTEICGPGYRELGADVLSKPIHFIASREFIDWKNDPAKDRRYQHHESYFEKTWKLGSLTLMNYRLLSQDEVTYLFLKMNYLRLQAEPKRLELVQKRDGHLLASMKSDLNEADQIASTIYNANTRLIIRLIKNFVRRDYDMDEAFSDAFYPAMQAIRYYNVDLGYSFGTYLSKAVFRGLSKIRSAKEAQTRWMVSGHAKSAYDIDPISAIEDVVNEFSPEMREAIAKLPEVEQAIILSYFAGGVELTEIAKSVGITRDRIQATLDHAISGLRGFLEVEFNSPASDQPARVKADISPFLWNYERNPYYREVFDALLNEEEVEIFRARFALDGGHEPRANTEIASELGVSREAVRTRIDRAIEDMDAAVTILAQIRDDQFPRSEAVVIRPRVQTLLVREILAAKNRIELVSRGLRSFEIKLLSDFYIKGRKLSDMAKASDSTATAIRSKIASVLRKIEGAYQIHLGAAPTGRTY